MQGIPEVEQDACTCIIINVGNLSQFVEAFSLSCQLFELLERGGAALLK